ncbi:MAG: nitrilase-related carbon-nitrogen hydrolase, partial [Gammaproteobacteria bacterium]
MTDKPRCRIVVAQLNFLVGNVEGNLAKIVASAERARDEYHADLIVFPELSLSGYPPEDLLLRRDFHNQIQKAITKLCETVSGIDIILGYPEMTSDGKLYNSLLMMLDQQVITNYRKQLLPNYGVFDEKRYFMSGEDSCVVNYKGLELGLLICEDLWFPKPAHDAVKKGAKLLISVNSSPFD